MTPDPVIEAVSLTQDFGSVIALDDVNLSIPHGVTGLVGANGAGKTTLLRILLGLIHPTSGRTSVLGHDSQTEPLAVRSRVGYMPEGSCLPRDQTAADFVSYAAELAGIPGREAKRRSSETLFLVGLAEERFRYIGDFSTGMEQRVKLAQALVHDPDLVLLDEPASGLDPEGREQMLDLILRLRDFQIDVVVSSHVLTDIERTCDWVVMLDGGRLLRSGPLGGFEQMSTVAVEVLANAPLVERRLVSLGFGATAEGRRLIVGPGGPEIEDAVVAAVADVGAGLVRMVRGTASLEDLFLQNSAETP